MSDTVHVMSELSNISCPRNYRLVTQKQLVHLMLHKQSVFEIEDFPHNETFGQCNIILLTHTLRAQNIFCGVILSPAGMHGPHPALGKKTAGKYKTVHR